MTRLAAALAAYPPGTEERVVFDAARTHVGFALGGDGGTWFATSVGLGLIRNYRTAGAPDLTVLACLDGVIAALDEPPP